jgi:uncharacterized membrane protein SpoIIM required for sporulation
VVLFTVMFSMPFVYYTIKLEENKIRKGSSSLGLLKEHTHALRVFVWLFLGFTVAFAFWYIVLPNTVLGEQIATYCTINRPTNYEQCLRDYSLKDTTLTTPFLTNKERLFLIFTNNMYVLIFTLVFSLLFGAGVIFVLAWNASVIGAAIGIFSKSQLQSLPLGLMRYMVHGIPEILAYFIVALAGGLVSIAVIKHETGTEKFWEVLQDSLNLIIASIVVLFIAALIEVFITPKLF